MPVRDDLALVLGDDRRGDLVLRHGARIQDPQVLDAVAGQLGISRHGLGGGAALADDELSLAQPERLAVADGEEGEGAQHRDAVPPLLLPVEVRHDSRALAAD